jgi:hypothetical protein
MASRRTAWHFFFTVFLRARRAPGFDVRDEVRLSDEPPRVDYLLLRHAEAAPPAETDVSLRGLWPRLALDTILELKSVGRPYRTGELDRLWGYVHIYHAGEHRRLPRRDDLRAALVVPLRTPALDADVDKMGLRWDDLGGGYWQVRGGLFPLYVAEIDVVAEQEDDDLLRLFSHEPERTVEGRRFWADRVGTAEARMALKDMDGYDEVMQKLLSGLTPEQRLAGLTMEQILLAATDDMLCGLPEDIVRSIEAVRSSLRQRAGR